MSDKHCCKPVSEGTELFGLEEQPRDLEGFVSSLGTMSIRKSYISSSLRALAMSLFCKFN